MEIGLRRLTCWHAHIRFCNSIYATFSECRTGKYISGEDPAESAAFVCMCDIRSVASLRRHCDILGRMVRESDTSISAAARRQQLYATCRSKVLKATIIRYMSLKSLNVLNSDTSFMPQYSEKISLVKVTHLCLLLHVAEKFWKQQLSGPTSCWRKDWMEWMQFYALGKYHRWEWELHITSAGRQQLSAKCSWKVWI